MKTKRNKLAIRVLILLLGAITGIVIGTFIVQAKEEHCSEKIVQMSNKYSYLEMVEDIQLLEKAYPQYVKSGSIGTSVLGRPIPYFTLGNPKSNKNILIQSSIHAREYLCTQMTMGITEHYLSNLDKYKEVLDSTCFYIVPMANPDGVMIAQEGLDSISNDNTKAFVNSVGHYTSWKANANGVDLNRNFDLGWENLAPRVSGPSYKDFKGETKVSEPETKALVAFAEAREYVCFISYHQQGNVIYYDEPGNTKENSEASTLLAKTIANKNGYKLHNLRDAIKTNTVQQGGFNDWVQIKFNKPGCTVELGTGLPPKYQKQITGIFNKNKDTWMAVSKLY